MHCLMKNRAALWFVSAILNQYKCEICVWMFLELDDEQHIEILFK